MKVPGTVCAADAISSAGDTTEALNEVLEGLSSGIGTNPDVATVFFTPHHSENAQEIGEQFRRRLGADVLVGCSASGVLGAGKEIEAGPGLTAWAARVPGAKVGSFHLFFDQTDEGGFVRGWRNVGRRASAVLLVDGYTFPTEPFLASLRSSGQVPRIVGGVASGASRSGDNRLIIDDRVVNQGVAGFFLDGPAALEPMVSQGCRPVGEPFKITKSERNVIYELSGAPAYEGLDAVLGGLEDEDQARFRQAPQVGLKIVDSTGEMGPGGYLIRGVVAVDRDSGAVAVGDHVKEGITIQFHARDSVTAHEDLSNQLGLASGIHPEAAGALLFTCNGRGRGMFQCSGHDTELVRTYFPNMAVAGMFAAGEIGNVCGLPYMHGFTASMGLLVQREG